MSSTSSCLLCVNAVNSTYVGVHVEDMSMSRAMVKAVSNACSECPVMQLPQRQKIKRTAFLIPYHWSRIKTNTFSTLVGFFLFTLHEKGADFLSVSSNLRSVNHLLHAYSSELLKPAVQTQPRRAWGWAEIRSQSSLFGSLICAHTISCLEAKRDKGSLGVSCSRLSTVVPSTAAADCPDIALTGTRVNFSHQFINSEGSFVRAVSKCNFKWRKIIRLKRFFEL